jgi:hypothetical protein
MFLVSAGMLCTASLWILSLPAYWAEPQVLAPAVAIDLSLGLPVLGYLFLVRTERSSWVVLIPLLLSGLGLSRWWIPKAHLDLTGGIEIVVVILEGCLLVFLVARIGRIRKTYRREKPRHPYPLDALRLAFAQEVGPRVGAAVFGELSVLWYAFTGWARRRTPPPEARVFPGHRRNAYPAVLSAILMAVLVETAILHLLLSLWIGRAAWIVTALGIYSVLWLVGDFQAARLNPSLSADAGLHLRTGLRWSADLRWTDIVRIQDGPPTEPSVRMALFGKPDLWLECREAMVVVGLFGMERRVRFLGLGLDDPEEFRRAALSELGRRMTGSNTGDPDQETNTIRTRRKF